MVVLWGLSCEEGWELWECLGWDRWDKWDRGFYKSV